MLKRALSLSVFLVIPAQGDILHVPGDAPTIQIAIQIARPFDTIIVAPGTWFEAIAYSGKVLAIQSEDPNDPDVVAETVIDAGGLGSVVTFAGPEGAEHATLNGFTITNGQKGIEGNFTLATIQNCVIENNTGTGIVEANGMIRHSIIRWNAGWGMTKCSGEIRNCRIETNWYGLSDCDGLIVDSRISNNRHSSSSNGLSQCDGNVLRCVISNNGYYGVTTCNASIRQTVISGNAMDGCYRCNGALIDNSIFAGNKGDGLEQCTADVLNCTVTGNNGFGFRSHTGNILHAIIWDNDGGTLLSSTTPSLSGTINPYFIQPGHWDSINNLWIDGDYHLAPDSPYIDAGDPFYGDHPGDPTDDLGGNPRVAGARVDIGAYELQEPCDGDDFDDDGRADICDGDIDDDGIGNTLDPCDFTPSSVPVDSSGRPRGDLNWDCRVDLRDYAVMQLSMMGP